ncbi:transcription factor divaricata [Phtheirospermum japonicum]|uniref:Transcription factor divaricata n=1 Tax=Phtheirospermum japonicum TaxID=374723 RepID=A0A830CFA1_9LAMI|nr:transcription factor divaricata [Phtheirospermum japonicum]
MKSAAKIERHYAVLLDDVATIEVGLIEFPEYAAAELRMDSDYRNPRKTLFLSSAKGSFLQIIMHICGGGVCVSVCLLLVKWNFIVFRDVDSSVLSRLRLLASVEILL